MRVKLYILAFTILMLQGCSVSNDSVEPQYINENAPVCGEYVDNSTQTFPSLKELENDPDAHFLHEGPCY